MGLGKGGKEEGPEARRPVGSDILGLPPRRAPWPVELTSETGGLSSETNFGEHPWQPTHPKHMASLPASRQLHRVLQSRLPQLMPSSLLPKPPFQSAWPSAGSLGARPAAGATHRWSGLLSATAKCTKLMLGLETWGSCLKDDCLHKHVHGHLCNKETVLVSQGSQLNSSGRSSLL